MGTDQREQVWAKTQGRCWYCGVQTTPWGTFSVDHMDPRNQGGGNEIENLVPACRSCNSQKRNKTLEEFRSYLIAKQHMVFWGDHLQIKTALPIILSVEQEEEDDSRPYEDLVHICLYTTDYNNPEMALTMLGLLSLGYDHCLEPNKCRFYLSFTDLQMMTRLRRPTLLAHIFRLLETNVFTVTWDTHNNNFYYVFDLNALEFAEPWELWSEAKGMNNDEIASIPK